MKLKYFCNYFVVLLLILLIYSCKIGIYDPGREEYSLDNSKTQSDYKSSKPTAVKNTNSPKSNRNTNKTNTNGANKLKTDNVDKSSNSIKNDKDATAINADEDKILQQVIINAKKHIGTPYKWGGTTPKGFDCSGYVQYVFKSCGIELPRLPLAMADMSTKISVDDLRPGDLVYFKGRDAKSSRIGHVAIVVKKTETGFEMIHSTSGRGVIINNINDYDYWKQRFLFASRFKTETLLAK